MVKNPPANAGDMCSIPGSGRTPGEGNGNPLQYSCLGNPIERGDLWATVYGVTRVRHDLGTKQYQGSKILQLRVEWQKQKQKKLYIQLKRV